MRPIDRSHAPFTGGAGRWLPPLADVLDAVHVVVLPLQTRFRGIAVREAVLLDGPTGWGEFAPFPEYPPAEAARWLAAAVEGGWGGWPSPRRDQVPVNAIVPAVDPADARRIVTESGGCTVAKVKVAEPGQSLEDDVARLAAVRAALGPDGRVRVDANGAWSVPAAADALQRLTADGPLEYVEQPCRTLVETAQLRDRLREQRTDVLIAVDEGVRKSGDPTDPVRVAALRAAADLVVVKVAPLGGVRAALDVVRVVGLPAVVSSALDTSVGLAAGAALAAALPDLPYACGLGSGRLLAADVVRDRLLPHDGLLPVARPEPDPGLVAELAAAPGRVAWWRSRLADTYAIMAGS